MNLEGSESIQPDAKTKSEKQVEGGIIIKRKERKRERERKSNKSTFQLPKWMLLVRSSKLQERKYRR